jgi:hypothetical protein
MAGLRSLLFVFIFSAFGTSHAGVFNFDGDPLPDFKAAVSGLAVASPAVPVPAAKEWTIMVYAEGKSSAEGISLYAVNMLEEGGASTEKVDIVAELSRMRGQFWDDPTDGDWTGARRYHIQKDDNFGFIRSPVIQSFDGVNTGDWRHLADFINWGRTNYPAKRYALVIIGHGSGWRDIGRNKGLALDEETGLGVENRDLARAIAASGGKLDLLVMNACLMQTAEALYDLKDSAAFIAGSENVMRDLPYDRITAAMNAAPEMDARSAAALFVDGHREANQNNLDPKPTFSAVDASRLNGFYERLDAWSRAALKNGRKKFFRQQAAASYRLDNRAQDSHDLGDFISLVEHNTDDAALKARSAELLAYLRGELVVKAWGDGPGVNGVAVYLPSGSYLSSYGGQALAGSNAWGEFLKKTW